MRDSTKTQITVRQGRPITRSHALLAIIMILGMLGSVESAMAQAPAPEEDLESKVLNESEELQRLKEQLAALESIEAPNPPLETVAVETPAPDDTALASKPTQIPAASLPGAEEEFANALFALGEYERARAIYQQVIESSPPDKTASWIYVQLGNCARRQGDFPGALSAYGKVMTNTPDSFWAEEAAWWTDQIKWRLLWNQMLNPNPLETTPAG